MKTVRKEAILASGIGLEGLRKTTESSNQNSGCHVLGTSQSYSLGELARLESGTAVVSALKTEVADFCVDICTEAHDLTSQSTAAPRTCSQSGASTHFVETSPLFRLLHRRHQLTSEGGGFLCCNTM